jgi:hypothetical protein
MTDPACHPSLAWAASRVRASLIVRRLGTLHAAGSMRKEPIRASSTPYGAYLLGERKRGR